MATKTVTLDDLDGSEGATTVRFGFGEKSWDIDLGAANATKLEKALGPFIDKGREVVKKAPAGNSDTAVIRQWLQENGHEVNDKGRIPEDKVALYRAAHPTTPTQ